MPKLLKCCILGCNENSRNVMEEISFHRIPKDEATRKQWIDLIRSKTNQTNVFSIHALVCSKHFEPNQFIERVNGSRLLINYAIPSIFPNKQREWFKPDGSDDDEFPVPSSTTVKTYANRMAKDGAVQNTDTDASSALATTVIKQEECDDEERNGSNDFQESCRFCLTIPASTQIEKRSVSEDIAIMYTTLTGIEFIPSTFAVPETICTTCSSKLKKAFEFREHLIKMNSHWETAIKIEVVEETIVIPMEPETVQSQDVFIIDESDRNSENFEVVEEFINFETPEDDDDYVEKQSPESDDDDDFIEDAANFIKTVRQVPRSELNRIAAPRPAGILLTKRRAKSLATDTERLNFRSSMCPHTTQKLKKDIKWWRLMHDCNYCEAKDFLTVDAINKHLKVEHAEQVKVTCDICKKDYSELKYLRKHMKYVHQSRPNKCTICDKKFYYNYNLKSHMLVHSNEKSVICHLCGKFFTPAALHGHMRSGVHGPVDRSSQKTTKIQKTRYYCYICVPAKRFDQCSELTDHRRLFHNDFECPICKGWFSCAESLQNHLKTHSNKERKHSCTLCPSTYVRASHLEGHMRRKHSSEAKAIACDLCDYKCVEQYELHGHKKHAHSKSKPFKCKHCEKSFSKDQAHKDHLLTTHGIGEYRYSCSECPKRFINSSGLISHRGIYHKGAGNTNS